MLTKMTIDEMVEKAYERMKQGVFQLSEERAKKYLRDYLEMSFNKEHTRIDKNQEDLLISYAATQCNNIMHPMTCGVDSRHALLVPRLVGHQIFLVCPTCGYLQIVGSL